MGSASEQREREAKPRLDKKNSVGSIFHIKAYKDLANAGSDGLVKLNLDGLMRIVEATTLTQNQRRTMEVLNSFTVQVVVGLLICSNMCLLINETDIIAAGNVLPSWMIVTNRLLLGIYLVELLARLYAYGMNFFISPFNLVDFTVVAADLVLEIYTLTTGSTAPSMTLARVLRLARLARAYRFMNLLPMLSGMVRDLVGAFEAVVWGCLLLGLFTTGWSVLAVQFIQPVVDDIVNDTDVFDGCERCPKAFASVWQANLTLFQTTIGGDSWGIMALPVIEHAWWTTFFFMGTVVTLNLAIMNVILAVVVEKADETRKSDLQEIMRMREQTLITKSKKMLKVCEDLDEDGSGDLTLEELVNGFETNKFFAAQFHEMGIDKDDMKAVFKMMDNDDSGTVDYREFVQHIRKMKSSDETTLLNLIRHNVVEVLTNTRKLLRTDTTSLEKQNGGDTDPPVETMVAAEEKHVRNDTSVTVDNKMSLFEESPPPPSHEFVREVSYRAKEYHNLTLPYHDGLEFTRLQRTCNELLERLSDNLDRSKDMARSQLETLHSIERSMGTMLANHDVERRSLPKLGAQCQESPRAGNEEKTVPPPSQRRNIGERISSSISRNASDSTECVLRPCI